MTNVGSMWPISRLMLVNLILIGAYFLNATEIFSWEAYVRL